MNRTARKDRTPLPDGQGVRDPANDLDGVIIDHARQYTHPQAAPIFIYMIRWQDGQIASVSEAAFKPGGGLSLRNDQD